MSTSPEHSMLKPIVTVRRHAEEQGASKPPAVIGQGREDHEIVPGCETPTAEESRISPAATRGCPPAPRKPRVWAVRCKRRPTKLFVVGAEELESLFRLREEEPAPPLQVAKKRKIGG